MRKRTTVFLFLISLGFVAFSRLGSLWPNGEEETTPLLDVAAESSALMDLPPVGEAVRFFEERVRRTPGDFISYTILGQMHARQARETGDVATYERAEAALREALVLLPRYSPAEASLAAVQYSQHDFAQALALAQQVYERDPKSIQALGTMGDAHLALGNYREAEDAYQKLIRNGPAPPALARLSRLKELEGNTEQALQLMERAADQALDSAGSRESMAWYLLRLGDLYFNAGRIVESAEHYEAALRVFDNYHLALAGLGKARAAQDRYHEAIDLYERAVAIIPQPATLTSLGDLYAKTGNGAQAQLQYDTVELIAKLATINEQVYNRALVLFYADHDIKLVEALDLAAAESAVRNDIYGYDALAWALYKNNRLYEATDAVAKAMKLGTQDANLYFHAGMIYHGRGDTQLARQYLRHALSLNPGFSILNADVARRTLEDINGKMAYSKNPEEATR